MFCVVFSWHSRIREFRIASLCSLVRWTRPHLTPWAWVGPLHLQGLKNLGEEIQPKKLQQNKMAVRKNTKAVHIYIHTLPVLLTCSTTLGTSQQPIISQITSSLCHLPFALEDESPFIFLLSHLSFIKLTYLLYSTFFFSCKSSNITQHKRIKKELADYKKDPVSRKKNVNI